MPRHYDFEHCLYSALYKNYGNVTPKVYCRFGGIISQGKERKGKERKGKERKGKERKGKERKNYIRKLNNIDEYNFRGEAGKGEGEWVEMVDNYV